MAKVKCRKEPPSALTLRLFDPGMSPIHRAGLGGLACALGYVERAVRSGEVAPDRAPGGPWAEGVPPWKVEPLQITLDFQEPEKCREFFERLFALTFQLRDGLIFLPPQHRNEPTLEVLAELQTGLLLTFLQHEKTRTMSKEETVHSYEIDEKTLRVAFRKCSFYRHQEGWKELTDSDGCLNLGTVEIAGPLNPGAVVRHVAFSTQTKIEEGVSRALPLFFSLVGCLALPVNRGCGVLLVPEVEDLVGFAKRRPAMTPRTVRECRVAGGSDAILQAQVRLRALETSDRGRSSAFHAAVLRPTPWASQQKSRVQTIWVENVEDEDLDLFALALAELPPKVLTPKGAAEGAVPGRKRKVPAKEDPGAFWVDSVVRPLVADNLAQGHPWYRGFVNLVRGVDPATKKPLREKLLFERGGLHRMIDQGKWKQVEDETVVRAVHEAMRLHYGRIASENQGNPGTMKNRMGGEMERWRLAFGGAKTVDQFRHLLCDFFSRGGSNAVLRDRWHGLLGCLEESRWQLTRDLALLALVSYKGKENEEGSVPVQAPDRHETHKD